MVNEWFKQYFNLPYVIGDNTKAFGFDTLKERTQEDANQILKFSQINDGRRIAGIPCGYGRIEIELARRIYNEIYGLDINPFLLNIAKYRTKHSLDVEENHVNIKIKPIFSRADMRNFSNKFNRFDLIYNWFWSFGYFSHKENLKTIKEFYSALNPEGKLLIHAIPKENLSSYLNEKRKVFPVKIKNKQYPFGFLSFEKSYEPKTKRLHTKWNVKLSNGNKLETPKSSIIIYSADEYLEMFKKNGFREVEMHDSYFQFKIFGGRK